MPPNHWRRYQSNVPEYLAQHYWWAYLSKFGVWFFDQPLMINLILYGQYQRILASVLTRYESAPAQNTLQIGCAYGAISPALQSSPCTQNLHIIDIAGVQLNATKARLGKVSATTQMIRMNADSLAYADNSFDCIVIFFLLHELPPEVRARTLSEAMRVLDFGGRLLIAEFGENSGRHFLHRLTPWRRILSRLEPFLENFWHSQLSNQLESSAMQHGKKLMSTSETFLFDGFYRVAEYRV